MITTYDQIRAIGNLKEAKDAAFAPWKAKIRLDMVTWFGVDVVVACEEYSGTEEPRPSPPELATNWESLALCEALLFIYYALPHLNTILSKQGGIAKDGKIGEGDYTYLSPKEMKERRAELLEQAADVALSIQGKATGYDRPFLKVVR